jgi:stalled ribosome rescue protein Dom34
MSLFRAVLLIDHHEARLVQFDAEHTVAERIREHSHHTKQHGSAVRSEHEFYAEVCEAMKGVAEVLVTGSHQSQADFRHYLQKHRPAQEKQVIGYETVDHPTEAQLVALARKVFLRHDSGLPTAS